MLRPGLKRPVTDSAKSSWSALTVADIERLARANLGSACELVSVTAWAGNVKVSVEATWWARLIARGVARRRCVELARVLSDCVPNGVGVRVELLEPKRLRSVK